MRSLIHYIYALLIIISAAAGVSSCTTNNGDIGMLYGVWNIDNITIDDVEQTSWRDGGWYSDWRFQNNIVQIRRFNRLHDYQYCVGTYTHTGNTLEFNFNHSDDASDAGTGLYSAPAWLYFKPGTTLLNIDSSSSSAMTVSTAAPDGKIITYYLTKQ